MVLHPFSRCRLLLPVLMALACGDSDPGTKPSPDAGPAAVSCSDLAHASLGASDVVLTKAEEVAASDGLPKHCVLTGSIGAHTGPNGEAYAIGFELRLPTENYKQRLYFQGGGGTDGVINPAYGQILNSSDAHALTRGYAVVSTDGGHTGQMDVNFGLDPQARSDYGYNAVGRVVGVAKKALEVFYDKAPAHSYFVGCSNGGRQALVAATRFSSEFDGIIAGDPGMNLPKAALAEAWDTQQFMSAATPGQLPKDAFPAVTLTTVATHIRAKCDALDGLEDGIVSDTEGCQGAFDLDRDVPTCADASATDCISGPQKNALKNIFGGVKDKSGSSLYSGWPWDPGLAGANWRFWKLDAGFAPLPLNTVVGSGALGYIFTTPPEQPDLSDGGLMYQLAFDFDASAGKIFARTDTFKESAMDFMTPPNPTDLGAFKERGGKLIVVHGTGDPAFSSNDTVAWYKALQAADRAAADYAKVFLVPGMNHCEGGPATDRFDTLSVLEDWVEKSVAPESMVAAVNAMNPDVVALGWPGTRTRLLCPYPQIAKLNSGASDTESASSFSCE